MRLFINNLSITPVLRRLEKTMLNNLSIRKKLYFGFFTIVAIILCLLIAAFQTFSSLSKANSWDQHTLQVLLDGAQIEQTINDLQAQHLKFIVNGNPASVQEI